MLKHVNMHVSVSDNGITRSCEMLHPFAHASVHGHTRNKGCKFIYRTYWDLMN